MAKSIFVGGIIGILAGVICSMSGVEPFAWQWWVLTLLVLVAPVMTREPLTVTALV